MTEPQSIVYVIDDDAAVRTALDSLIRSVGYRVETFSSTQEFLKFIRAKPPDLPSCLILDVRLPGISGLDFQRKLTEFKVSIPIIFISGHADIPMTVRAMKAGAVEFLTKPWHEQSLLDAIHQAIERDTARREQEKEIATLQDRLEWLTPRERCCRMWFADCPINKSPPRLEPAKPRLKSIAANSCERWVRTLCLSW